MSFFFMVIEQLKKRFETALPGKDFQLRMAHAARLEMGDNLPASDSKSSAVLVLIYPKSGEWHLLLIERTHRGNDRHGGQVSFPGGKFELSDIDLAHCALRETFEEVGVEIPMSQIIGEMTELYIPVSNFRVVPYLAYSELELVFNPSVSEVKRVLETPLGLLEDPETIKVTDLWISEKVQLKYVPYYDVFGKMVWGATAMMISELLEIMSGIS